VIFLKQIISSPPPTAGRLARELASRAYAKPASLALFKLKVTDGRLSPTFFTTGGVLRRLLKGKAI
jgi:hypothetical protein